MKVHEFIEWLKTQDQDADVYVVYHTSAGGYYCQCGEASIEIFDPNRNFTYTDFRGNQFVKPDSEAYNTRTLLIGNIDE